MAVKYFCSTTYDGTMKSANDDAVTARNNRVLFIKKCGLLPENSTLHTLSYGGNDYCRYINLNDSMKGDGIIRESTVDADAVVVTRKNHAILLPLADCIGAVVYDPNREIMMVSHLGRHNLEQNGGENAIIFLKTLHRSDPERLIVWLSPAAGSKTYPLFNFQNRSLHEVAISQLRKAGVQLPNISVSKINSATSPHYYSHSKFLAGKQYGDGRHAILATMA